MPSNTYYNVYYDEGTSPCFLSLKDGGMETFNCRFIDVVQKASPGKTFGFSEMMQNAECYVLIKLSHRWEAIIPSQWIVFSE